MAIKKAGDTLQMQKLVLVIQGLPGVGKTTLALSARNSVLVDCDKKLRKTKLAHRINAGIIEMESIPSLYEDLKSPYIKDYETIIFDTGGTLISYLTSYVISLNPKAALADGITLQIKGWGDLKREFIKLIDYCRYSLNKNIIIVVHMKEEQKKINGENQYKYKMDVAGSSSVFIQQQADLMCMMEIIDGKRTLGFSPTENYDAKSAYGIHGVINVPELGDDDANNYLERMFNSIDKFQEDERKRVKDMKSNYDTVMKSVRKLISGVESVKSANLVLSEFNKIKFPYNSNREAWTLLKQKAEELGMEYKPKTKKFGVKKNEISDNTQPVK